MCLWRKFYPGGPSPGGSVSRLTEDIYREAAYIAYHFGWSRKEILSMSRRERKRWLQQISRINQVINRRSRGKEEEES